MEGLIPLRKIEVLDGEVSAVRRFWILCLSGWLTVNKRESKLSPE